MACVCRQISFLSPLLTACLQCRNRTVSETIFTLCEQTPDGTFAPAVAEFVADQIQFLAGPVQNADAIYGRYWNQSASYNFATDPNSQSGNSNNNLTEITGARVRCANARNASMHVFAEVVLLSDWRHYRLHHRRRRRLRSFNVAGSILALAILLFRIGDEHH